MTTAIEFPFRTVLITTPVTDPAVNEAQQMQICDRYMEEFSKVRREHLMLDLYLRGVAVAEICQQIPCSLATLYGLLNRRGVAKRNPLVVCP